MKRLFFSLYSALIATIILFIFVAHWINTYLLIDVDNIIEAQNFKAEIELLQQLTPYISEKEINKNLAKIANLNQVIVNEVEYSAIPDFVKTKLTQDQVWVDDNELAYFWAFEPKKYFSIAEDESHELVKVDIIIEYTIIGLMLSLLAAISFIWMKFLGNKLNYLEQATKKFGEGDFTSRAPEAANLAVGNLNFRFNTMASKIEHLLASHKQLSHNIAHELRTPMFKMQMQLELLDSSATPKQQKYISGIEEDLFNLQDLVEELLQYAQAERAELPINFQSIKVQNIISNIIDDLIPTTEQTINVKYDSKRLPSISADKNLIHRVIKNLIHNAIKYGNSIIEVSINLCEEHLIISIDDNGPGINPSHLSKIFEPFYQIDSNQNGYGLGLSLAKQITKLHHGNLHYEPSYLGGAKFSLELPLN